MRAQVARGELPGFKRGGQWVIRKEALPLSEAQRAALQQKAETLRGALEDALPPRLAERAGQTRRGLADLDAFTRCAALSRSLQAARPEDAPGVPVKLGAGLGHGEGRPLHEAPRALRRLTRRARWQLAGRPGPDLARSFASSAGVVLF